MHKRLVVSLLGPPISLLALMLTPVSARASRGMCLSGEQLAAKALPCPSTSCTYQCAATISCEENSGCIQPAFCGIFGYFCGAECVVYACVR